MKKFLLITYYWPPAGGGGVMRWVKMTKYIQQFGWEPIVYTPLNGETAAYDESLLKEVSADLKVIKTPIWEPYELYKKITGRKKEDKIYSGFINEGKKESLGQKISVFIRGNFFIPDARMFWIKPSARFLKRYLRDNPVDAIVSTGPPHSMHLIAQKIHQSTGIPWITDFRDPWTNIDFYHELKLSAWADARHHSLEQQVLQKASRVVVVSWHMQSEFEKLCNRKDIVTIPNGFDDTDFKWTDQSELDEDFSISHLGSMNKDRNPEVFWQALGELIEGNAAFKTKLKIQLVGSVDFVVRNAIEKYGLSVNTEFIDFVAHNESVILQQKSQLLLLLINNSPNARTLLTGKLFEYLAAGRPIFAIGPVDGDSAKVLEQTKAGVMCDFNDVQKMKDLILSYFQAYENGNLKGTSENINRFSRRNLAADFANLLTQVSTKP